MLLVGSLWLAMPRLEIPRSKGVSGIRFCLSSLRESLFPAIMSLLLRLRA